MEQHLNFQALQRNLVDVIQEFQIKLGYAKETMGLYYPLESLNRLLDSDLDAAGMSFALQEFSIFAKKTLGDISVSRNDTRFCIRIPEDGVEYVHDKAEDTRFLKSFIEKISCCGLDINDILEVFHQYSNHVGCEKIDSEEFDYLVYFTDGIPDNFRYCIKFEGACAIYHRFTPKDYEALDF